MHSPTAAVDTRWTRGAARAVSEIFAPAVLVTGFLLLSTLTGSGWPMAVAYAVVAVVFTTALPLGVIVLLVRRGRITDHHISDRRQRAPILAAALVSITIGLILLVLLDAPWRVTGTVVCTIAGLVAVLLVNLWWKLSAHSAVAMFVVVGTASLVGPWGWLTAPMALAVGWSRVRLRAHTPAQAIAGAAVGVLIGVGFAVLVACY